MVLSRDVIISRYNIVNKKFITKLFTLITSNGTIICIENKTRRFI